MSDGHDQRDKLGSAHRVHREGGARAKKWGEQGKKGFQSGIGSDNMFEMILKATQLKIRNWIDSGY